MSVVNGVSNFSTRLFSESATKRLWDGIHCDSERRTQVVGTAAVDAVGEQIDVEIADVRREIAALAKDRVCGRIGEWGVVLQHPVIAGVCHVKIPRAVDGDAAGIAQVVGTRADVGGIAIAVTRGVKLPPWPKTLLAAELLLNGAMYSKTRSLTVSAT